MAQLAGGWTLEKLQAKTPEERFNVWTNARAKGTPEADDLAAFIESSGLNYTPTGGISMSDPRVIEMREIIESPAGQAACLAATAGGLPALAGVEPMIVERMGVRYGQFSMMTVTAGSIVGGMMLSKGYTIESQKKMPEGSVAKTAAFWTIR
ncbi:hypothetical protein [Brevundimonas sp. DC300-4]|uniref:hypothetical protein n=1 Tax=Brevundimonas sp. DC300-4 TaxID=2804594 RepID=UPI003CFAE03F